MPRLAYVAALIWLCATHVLADSTAPSAASSTASATARSTASSTASPTQRKPIDVDTFHFDVDTPRIILGETTRAVVTITAKTADGAPLDGAAPTLSTSTGTLSAPTRTQPGTWTAVFTPPKDAFPHVALVAAVVDRASSTALGFLPLRLWGKGQTTVKTKPKSAVTVFIGNDSFGPVTAGADGAAKVDIVVPPGPERAVAKSVDDVGNESQKTIDLGVPGFNRVAATSLDAVAPGDEARVVVLAVDKKGDPLFEAKLASKASAGDVDQDATPLAPGVFLVGFRPRKPGPQTVDVALDGAPGSVAHASVEVLTGKPARAEVKAAKDVLTADDARAVPVDVRVLDAAGNTLAPASAVVDVDVGRVESTIENGVRKVTWTIPAQLTRPHATLTVRTSTGAVLAQKDIALLAGKPRAIAFDPIETVVADGNSAVDVKVRVTDDAGNALVPTGLALSVDDTAGKLVAGTVDGTLYRARFIPAARDHAGFAPIHAALGALTADAQVKIAPRPRALLLVGVGALAATNYASLQAGPDVSLLVRVPGFDGSLHAGLSVEVLQSLAEKSGTDRRAYPLALEIAWRPLLAQDVALHVGVAGGLVLVDDVVGSERTVSPGACAQAVIGAGYRLGPGFLELDARAGSGVTFAASPSTTSPSTSAAKGAADAGSPVGAAIVLGYRFGI